MHGVKVTRGRPGRHKAVAGLRGTKCLKPIGKTRQFIRKGARAVAIEPIAEPLKSKVVVATPIIVSPEERGEHSSLELYLREIGRVALLTREEECELAARIKKGDPEAREHMIKANLRLVVKIARDYEHCGLPLLDLINEGNIGLMRAVERFDPAKGGKLSTYGSWWIKQSIRRALANQSKTIRLPVNATQSLFRLRRAAAKFNSDYGREPSDLEMAQELGLTEKRVAELNAASVRPASLDAPLGDDEARRLSDVVEDDKNHLPFEAMDKETDLEALNEVLEKLGEREGTILRLRFGLDGKGERTLEQVGQMFKLTRERIRQLQNVALAKLRRLLERREEQFLAA